LIGAASPLLAQHSTPMSSFSSSFTLPISASPSASPTFSSMPPHSQSLQLNYHPSIFSLYVLNGIRLLNSSTWFV
jgi:hypothetical protein